MSSRSVASTVEDQQGYTGLALMEDLLDKLKLLDYEEEFIKGLKMRPLNSFERLRVITLKHVLPEQEAGDDRNRHYFAINSNPGEQFFMFTSLVGWLLRSLGREFKEPQEDDDPNTTVVDILQALVQLGIPSDYPVGRLKKGCGWFTLQILDSLTDRVMEHKGVIYKKAVMNEGSNDTARQENDELVVGDDLMSELILEDDGEEGDSDDQSDEDNMLNIDDLYAATKVLSADEGKREHILESRTTTEEWNIELERVLPSLKVSIKSGPAHTILPRHSSSLLACLSLHRGGSDGVVVSMPNYHAMGPGFRSLRGYGGDWRSHYAAMKQEHNGLSSRTGKVVSKLGKMATQLTMSLDTISSREQLINRQLDPLLQEYRTLRDELSAVNERYKEVNGGVVARQRQLDGIEQTMEQVRLQTEERAATMSDGCSESHKLYVVRSCHERGTHHDSVCPPIASHADMIIPYVHMFPKLTMDFGCGFIHAPLIQIKKAIKDIKSEMKLMDINIAMVEHNIFQSKLKRKALASSLAFHAMPVI
ncbi:hypothetical protein AAG570_004264 [Ranatra chinensis]|uniref:Uncharacterized protein n=1 Tax=Ranatra chinensis TaxID=642074 RepID=A0ABD0Y394_9HEMI